MIKRLNAALSETLVTLEKETFPSTSTKLK